MLPNQASQTLLTHPAMKMRLYYAGDGPHSKAVKHASTLTLPGTNKVQSTK